MALGGEQSDKDICKVEKFGNAYEFVLEIQKGTTVSKKDLWSVE